MQIARVPPCRYGNAAPGSVANIVAAARAGAYDGTALSKVLPGRYLVAGTQGPKRSGLVQAPPGLPPNPDVLSAAAFRLPHRRPGTVSLNLSGGPAAAIPAAPASLHRRGPVTC